MLIKSFLKKVIRMKAKNQGQSKIDESEMEEKDEFRYIIEDGMTEK